MCTHSTYSGCISAVDISGNGHKTLSMPRKSLTSLLFALERKTWRPHPKGSKHPVCSRRSENVDPT